MAHVLIMPRQGNTVESCVIGEWKVKEGDAVKADTPVCTVETDKAAFEVPAGEAGTVLKILHPEGDDVPVLQPILVIGGQGENWETAVPGGASSAAVAAAALSQNEAPASVGGPAAVQIQPQKEGAAPVSGGFAGGKAEGRAAVSPRAKRLAFEEAVNPADIAAGSGPGGRVIEQDVAAFAAGRPPLTAAAKDELRRRVAEGRSSNIGGAGSAVGGRISAAELDAVLNERAAGNVAAPPANFTDEYSDAPIKGIRKLIAEQMMKSCLTTAAFTLNSSADAVNLQRLRSRFKASPPELGMSKITVNDLVLFAVSRVLPLYPYMNAHKLDGTLRSWKNVHLGVAVSTPRGLMVPVIRDADQLSLGQISSRARELAEACRSGSIGPGDLHGSTFTVSNLGNTGIESFSPVINIPEAAILGVCSITPKPAETSPGRYEILPHLGFSLTIDHAVVDGAPAAEFLKTLCGAIRDIDLWIAR